MLVAIDQFGGQAGPIGTMSPHPGPVARDVLAFGARNVEDIPTSNGGRSPATSEGGTLRIRPRHLLAVLLGTAITLGALALPAGAAPTPAVTLAATPTTLKFGAPTTVYGHITPRQGGKSVKVMDERGRVWARPTTNARGKFKAAFVPRRNMWLHAEWNGAKRTVCRMPAPSARTR